MAVTLTARAAERIQSHIIAAGKGLGLSLSTKPSGCAQRAYVLGYATEIAEADCVFEHAGAKVVVPRADMAFLDGTEIDFVAEGLNCLFKFNNPNVEAACGCGESFTVKSV